LERWSGEALERWNVWVAFRYNGTLRYVHSDHPSTGSGHHLGSSSGQTDTSGNAIAASYLRYYAYGTLRSGDPSQSTTDRTYTGQKQDGTGLLYYNARYYDPALGMFLSPDRLVPDAGRVVDYNRFLHVRGNPLKYSDPSGHLSLDEIQKYFGYDADEYNQMVNDWGQAVTEQLWDTSFTWGDVLSYQDGDAMLVLFEYDDDNRYQGGFWGIAGEGRGARVGKHDLRDSTYAGKNVSLTDRMAALGLSGIPNRINSVGH